MSGIGIWWKDSDKPPPKPSGPSKSSKKPSSKPSDPSKGSPLGAKKSSTSTGAAPEPPESGLQVPQASAKTENTSYPMPKHPAPAAAATASVKKSASGLSGELEKETSTSNPAYGIPATSPGGASRLAASIEAEVREEYESGSRPRSTTSSFSASSSVDPRLKGKGVVLPSSKLSEEPQSYTLDPVGRSNTGMSSTVSRGTQADSKPTSPASSPKPTLGLRIPYEGKTIPSTWAEQIAEELKDAREMMRDALAAGWLFDDWQKKAQSAPHLPTPAWRIDYQIPKQFARDLWKEFFNSSKNIREYDAFAAWSMRNPEKWRGPDFRLPREEYSPASLSLVRLAGDDADANRKETGQSRYEDWYLLKQFVARKLKIAKRNQEMDDKELAIFMEEGITENEALKKLYDFKIAGGIPPEEAKARVNALR